MRMMLTVTIDVEAGNQAILTGEMPKLVAALCEKIKPEASYFTSVNGKRTSMFFFEMTDSSQMPPMLEPLYEKLKAGIVLSPVMNLEDLQNGFKAMLESR
ncbi:MAG: hypothetical protein NT007_14620 [Candidatus Kapabacteria bacterium]|nr:hypothetical protein [Candidatus Kapabacteria bacterium]